MKIKGFSMLELLLVLVLSSFVVGIGWMVYRNMAQYGCMFEADTDEASAWILLDDAIRQDLYKCDSIEISPQTWKLFAHHQPLADYHFTSTEVKQVVPPERAFPIPQTLLSSRSFPQGIQIQVTQPKGAENHPVTLSYLFKPQPLALKDSL